MANNLEESDEIRLLKYPDAVRHRIGMYLSGVDQVAVNTSLREVQDNAIDEIASGYGDTIYVSNDFNGCNCVFDNGRGISIAMSKDVPTKTSAWLAISELHSGSKFSSTGNARVGQNGLGISIVSAVSDVFILLSRIGPHNYDKSIPEVRSAWESAGPRSRHDLYYYVVASKGLKVMEGAGRLKDLEKIFFKGVQNPRSIPPGFSTLVFYRLDPTIFTDSIKPEISIRNLQYFLLIQEKIYGKKVNVVVNDQVLNNTFNPYQFEFVKELIPGDTSMNPKLTVYVTFDVDPKLGSKSEIGSVNSLEVNQGVHIQYIENCFKESIRDYFKIKHSCLDNGLQMCVVVLAGEVIFDSQVKTRLRQITKVKPSDFAPLVKEFQKIFKKNEAYWSAHVQKLDLLAESMKSIGAADKAQKMIDSSSGVNQYRSKADLPKGFADATSKDRSQCELLICEGLSAGGSLIMGRKDTKTNAVLSLRGKILNVTDKGVDRALESKVISDIFNIIGLGLDVNWVGKDAKTYEEAHEIIKKRSRYEKIIIATD